jgi:hypothetical protein
VILALALNPVGDRIAHRVDNALQDIVLGLVVHDVRLLVRE